MWFKNVFNRQRNTKITPKVSDDEQEIEEHSSLEKIPLEMEVIRLHTVFKLYGGQRHPRLESYETLKARGDITEYKYLPPYSTTIYVSVRRVLESSREFHFFHLSITSLKSQEYITYSYCKKIT